MKSIDVQQFGSERSSVIKAMAYRDEDGAMYVQFHRKGVVWRYANVPRDVYGEMLSADSLGSFLATSIKKHYSAIEVEPEEWAQLLAQAKGITAEERAAAYESANARLYDQLRRSPRALGF